ncbi:hypothetical protein A9K55_003817 [Cordyceps militaris]|uniref:Uncharacterized protein n=1 Tax=Cordyceps militaris TaxID=73501 RepID=A0A2H4SQ02_CORMI|nr:hypothetical protein A9K55_003817 [Cordyceps militaris]
MPTFKATLLLVLAAVTGAAAAPAHVVSCDPGGWVMSALCSENCCRESDVEGRGVAWCAC